MPYALYTTALNTSQTVAAASRQGKKRCKCRSIQGVCHTPLRRCKLLVYMVLSVCIAYCIRPVRHRTNLAANHRAALRNPRFVEAYGILPVYHRVKRITNRCGNIAKRCNSGRMPYTPTAAEFCDICIYSLLARLLFCHPVVKFFHCFGNGLAGGCEIPRQWHEAEHETLGGIA